MVEELRENYSAVQLQKLVAGKPISGPGSRIPRSQMAKRSVSQSRAKGTEEPQDSSAAVTATAGDAAGPSGSPNGQEGIVPDAEGSEKQGDAADDSEETKEE